MIDKRKTPCYSCKVDQMKENYVLYVSKYIYIVKAVKLEYSGRSIMSQAALLTG